MSKSRQFLKKPTGAAKAPVVVDRKRHGLGRSVDFSGGVNGLLGTPVAVPVAAGQALELPDEVKQLLAESLLSVGHAKVLLSVDGERNLPSR